MSTSSRSGRGRGLEATLAILFAAVMVAVGGTALWFMVSRPVHSTVEEVPSSAAGTPPAAYASVVDQAKRLARSVVVEANLPSLSVAVAHKGTTVWAEAFGWADVDRKEVATPRSRYRIGGASIPMASAAVGLLLEQRRLDLDAEIQQYVRGYPKKSFAITLRQVMGHIGGIQHDGMPGRRCSSLDRVLPVFRDDLLAFEPGTEYRYSVYDWILVSLAIEQVTGEPFGSFMSREVLTPLGLEGTVPDEEGAPGRVSFYFPRMEMRTELGLQDAPEADYSCLGASGAYLSTPSDLVRFASAMLQPRRLKPETVALLQTPLRLNSGAATTYGLGWKVEQVEVGGAKVRLVGHPGTAMGGTTAFITFPELDLAIAATTNISHAKSVAPFALKLAEVFAAVK